MAYKRPAAARPNGLHADACELMLSLLCTHFFDSGAPLPSFLSFRAVQEAAGPHGGGQPKESTWP